MTKKDAIIQGFRKDFGFDPDLVVECGGRLEIIGNHTDHNHGLCLVAACDLTILCGVHKRNDSTISIHSQGMMPFSFDSTDLRMRISEYGTSISLVRGVASYFSENGYRIGGFDAYMESTIFQGAGVSSSAAFEVLIAKIFNVLYNRDQVSKLVMAKAGQYSENNYFGKQSGLLDQIGVSYGGLNFVDFKDTDNPIVKEVKCDLSKIHLVLVNPGGSHATLSHLYSSIPKDMLSASRKLGVQFLRLASENEFNAKCQVPGFFTPMEESRARHFFEEEKRVTDARSALERKDLPSFFHDIAMSQESSKTNLKNTMVDDHYEGSPQEAVDLADSYLPTGAARIHGGGFAGTIICFVPDELFDNFMDKMSVRYGKNGVHEVHVRLGGASVI